MSYYTPTECNTITNHLVQNVFNQLDNIGLTNVSVTPVPDPMNFRFIQFDTSFRNRDTMNISLEMDINNNLTIYIKGGTIADRRIKLYKSKIHWIGYRSYRN